MINYYKKDRIIKNFVEIIFLSFSLTDCKKLNGVVYSS